MVTLAFNGLFCYYIKLLYCLRQAWFMSQRRAHGVNIIDVDDAAAAAADDDDVGVFNYEHRFLPSKYKSKKKLFVIVYTIFKNMHREREILSIWNFCLFSLPFQPFENNNSRTGVKFYHFDDASKKTYFNDCWMSTNEKREHVCIHIFFNWNVIFWVDLPFIILIVDLYKQHEWGKKGHTRALAHIHLTLHFNWRAPNCMADWQL